jgi:hypothetical protein
MQCPDCGYDVDDAAVFCPQCRYHFQETDEAPVVPDTTIPDTPVRYGEIDESIFEERQKTLSDKELRMLKIQLLQPAVHVFTCPDGFLHPHNHRRAELRGDRDHMPYLRSDHGYPVLFPCLAILCEIPVAGAAVLFPDG